ncbi:hypothetical protein [Paludifilum halophilum]|uniref:Uncharacterized protein n=1 Tax=Paludifilum halophilum TaxID=1642702 RepID=A0A235B1V4_9BACL|nr:hypothetical protein [Paludifilum halophilum]OYD06288.1 hypothetical protein CHM34_17135 [Paludifilum halophilum]
MSKMEKSRNHLEKALQLKGETRALALDIKRKTERKLSEIHADVKLTEVGKSEARLEAQELAAVEASRRALNLQQGVRANLAMAKKAAQEVVNRKVKKPSADQVERFQRELNRVKTSLMLEREGKKALDSLTGS